MRIIAGAILVLSASILSGAALIRSGTPGGDRDLVQMSLGVAGFVGIAGLVIVFLEMLGPEKK